MICVLESLSRDDRMQSRKRLRWPDVATVLSLISGSQGLK